MLLQVSSPSTRAGLTQYCKCPGSGLGRVTARWRERNYTALHALESTEERGHSANRQTAPVSIELSQQQERQRSGSLASTSGSSQVSSQPQSRTDDSFRQSNSNTPSPTTAPSWVAAVRGLISSKHDAMIFNLALPSLLALAADPLLAVTDTAFVGQLGANELAAFSINSSVFTFAFLVFNFLSTATTPAVAAALATDDKEKAGQTISQALFLALVLGGGAAAILTLQATPVLEVMGVEPGDETLFSLALQFLYIRATAAPAALLVSVSQGVFRGLQDMRTPLGVTVATNILHLGLSLLFIFQLHMGLPGAALSISISEWAAAATYLALGWSKRSQLGLDKGWVVAGNTRKTSTTLIGSSSSSSSSKDANSEGASTSLALETVASSSSCSSSNGREGIQPQRNPATPTSAATNITSTAFRTFAASYAPFLQAGGAVLMRTGLLLGTKTLASAVAMRLGPEQMSTHQILYQVWLVASLAVDSLAISGQVAVAVNLGKGDLNAAREVSDRLLQLGVGLGGSLALVLLIADPVWPRTFTQEADVIAAVQALSPLALALLPINSVVYVLDGVFVGANDYTYLVKAMLVAAMLGTPLLLAVQPMNLGLDGVWWGLSALMIGRCLGLLYRYNSPDGPVPPLALATKSSKTAAGKGGDDGNGINLRTGKVISAASSVLDARSSSLLLSGELTLD